MFRAQTRSPHCKVWPTMDHFAICCPIPVSVERTLRAAWVLSLLLVFAAAAWAEDWPMYRCDAGRTGTLEQALDQDVELAWTRQLSPLKPAFRNPRLQFDAGYEPVVAGELLFVGSSQSDSLTAYKTRTGERVWTFYAGGPIRLAPAVWEQSICFGSDDGYLYCLDLSTGKLRWKHRAGPSARRLFGNQRLISVWPVRGGPVVADGRVYFAAGVWPFEGVFVYAMDIASGQVVWRNDRLGYLYGQQPHNTQAIGGLAPQGYLVVDGDELIVPCSTAYPARLNRNTGELIEFKLPSPGRLPGGWFAALTPEQSKAVRRGQLTFDDLVNRQRHEDKVHVGRGESGVSRRIRVGQRQFDFDMGFPGVEGTVHSMVVGDGRLFVVSREGTIYCFQPKLPGRRTERKNWPLEKADLLATPDEMSLARSFVASSLSDRGIAVVVGLKDGAMVRGLLAESRYHVVVIDDHAKRVRALRRTLDSLGYYGARAAVLEADLSSLRLPPYIVTLLTTERDDADWTSLLSSLRPYGGVASIGRVEPAVLEQELGEFKVDSAGSQSIVRRTGELPGASDYTGDWTLSPDKLVRFPLGVLWFDDELAHFKRSPQPRFIKGVMISRPKDWRAPRIPGNYKVDYPLLPPVLSDMYTGRVLHESEMTDLRSQLQPTDPKTHEPSQYRPPSQRDAWKPRQPVVGERRNPMTGVMEPRAFPKTYGCDGGVDYGDFYTLRSGTAAYYDKAIESGTVFLSGPRSGCTNSIIPAGGLLNVPYFFEGCTCSYPLPSAMSLVSMPESHEQWSSWGKSSIQPNSIERLGLNFGAPGDRIARSGTLWLDFPAVGGPSPKVRVAIEPSQTTFQYQHSGWMTAGDPYPWVSASVAEGLKSLVIQDLKAGSYTVRLYFAEPRYRQINQRVQTIKLQGRTVLANFDIIAAAGSAMQGVVREVSEITVEDGKLHLELSASKGQSLLSGVEVIHSEAEGK